MTTTPVETSDAAPVGVPAGAEGESLGAYARRWWSGVRAGELGSLPIIVGLILIAIIFQSQNDRFLTAGNLTNLFLQITAVGLISVGVVYVLLLGEIDLSAGFVAGIGGVVMAHLGTNGDPLALLWAVLITAAVGAPFFLVLLRRAQRGYEV